jgi:hypothetical protein
MVCVCESVILTKRRIAIESKKGETIYVINYHKSGGIGHMIILFASWDKEHSIAKCLSYYLLQSNFHFILEHLACYYSLLLGVSENPDRLPEHEREGKTDKFSSSTQMTLKETRNLQKTAQASEVVNAFTRALAPLFIGRRRDFYILKIPLGPKEYS